MKLSASQQKGLVMSDHTRFSLDRPWKFPSWDNLKSSEAPWVYRGFWYHDGEGDYLVFVWKYSLDDAGWCYSGHIHRHTNIFEAIKTLFVYRKSVEVGLYDGAFVFYGRRHPSTVILGEPFPEALPDNRW